VKFLWGTLPLTPWKLGQFAYTTFLASLSNSITYQPIVLRAVQTLKRCGKSSSSDFEKVKKGSGYESTHGSSRFKTYSTILPCMMRFK